MSRIAMALRRFASAFRMTREEREQGITLIEMMAVVALMSIIGAPQIQAFMLERSKASVATAVSTLDSLGEKVQQYCDDNNQTCSTVTMAKLVAGGYVGNTVTPPGGGTYTFTVTDGNTATNASAVIVITDSNYYNKEEVVAQNIRTASGAAQTAATGPNQTIQLEYQNSFGGVTTQT